LSEALSPAKLVVSYSVCFSGAKLVYNSKWLGKMNFEDVLNLSDWQLEQIPLGNEI
jgi:hypothetical protein